MNLSPTYHLEDFVISQHRDIDNRPPESLIPNLKRLAMAAEEIDLLLHGRINLTSGYRCSILNALVGGSKTSRHVMGLAIDFIAPFFGTPLLVCKAIIESPIEFDQIIYEHTWVHFGLSPDGIKPRRVVFTKIGPESYVKGLVEEKQNRSALA